ncbi:MAG: Mn2+/Fe2+ transporter, family [Bryobacterales bacterium]|nr:Mn2+/Fe2+ transporter, family [Bryobacterales bacterium]
MHPNAYSLPEVHQSVHTGHASRWKRLLAFAGPAYLVSVGYMDPGNWATDLEGGARFGYQLLWVLVASNLVALLLQTLSARLGIVTGRDLAQACRDEYPRAVSYTLWILCELAIVACDLAEVLGAAIGLNLLFHLPLLFGVLVTATDTLLVLWLSRLGIRVIEAFVLVLIATIAGCFAFEIFLAHPETREVMTGMIPRLNSHSLYFAVAIFGATVMPHNLYLHSALVQTRRIGESDADKRTASRFNLLDSAVALNGALFVNAAILVVAATIFFKHGIVVTEIQQAHQLLSPLVGTRLASLLFGLALLCSGQASTLTGTMAGQIVMEGFLRFRMQPWLRRAVTRFLAITPAVAVIYFFGERSTTDLIVLSQVILNLQLPFAVIPLVHFTSDRKRMGQFANSWAVKLAAWGCALFILTLDVWLLRNQIRDWLSASGSLHSLVLGASIIVGLGSLTLLAVITLWPWYGTQPVFAEPVGPGVRRQGLPHFSTVAAYSRILVPLDQSDSDLQAINSALPMASTHGARIILLHVEEGVTSQLFGSLSSTAEIKEGEDYLTDIATLLRQKNVNVEIAVRHGKSPAVQIASAVKEFGADVVVMASHGHRGWKDLVFGTTINSLRHRVKVPLLIVQGS